MISVDYANTDQLIRLEPKNLFSGEGRYLLQYVDSVSQCISQPDKLMTQNSDTTLL